MQKIFFGILISILLLGFSEVCCAENFLEMTKERDNVFEKWSKENYGTPKYWTLQEEYEKLSRKVATESDELFGKNPIDCKEKERVASDYIFYAKALIGGDENQKCKAVVQRVIDLYKPGCNLEDHLAWAYYFLAEAERADKPENSLRKAAAVCKHTNICYTINMELADYLQSVKRYKEALDLYEQTTAMLQSAKVFETWRGTRLLYRKIILYDIINQNEESVKTSKQLVDMLEKHPNSEMSLLSAYKMLAEKYRKLKNCKAAADVYEKTIAEVGQDDNKLKGLYGDLWTLYRDMGLFAKALPFLERDLKVIKERLRLKEAKMSEREKRVCSLYDYIQRLEKIRESFQEKIRNNDKSFDAGKCMDMMS